MNAADRKFLNEMLPHHQAALTYARAVLKSGQDERVRRLAANILKTQSAEIQVMKSLGAVSSGKREHASTLDLRDRLMPKGD